jgi:hypothetical protein
MVVMAMDMVMVGTLLRMVVILTPAGIAISMTEVIIAGEKERSNPFQRT